MGRKNKHGRITNRAAQRSRFTRQKMKQAGRIKNGYRKQGYYQNKRSDLPPEQFEASIIVDPTKGLPAIAEKRHKKRKLRLRKGIFANYQFGRTEIDQEAVFYPTSAEITKQLGDMFVCQALAGFKLNDQAIFNEQIGQILRQTGSFMIFFCASCASLRLRPLR